MKLLIFTCIALFALPCSATPAKTERELLVVVKNFYTWVLSNGVMVQILQPKIESVPGSVRLHINLSTLPNYSAKFMSSGNFSEKFPEAVRRYYNGEQAKLEALPQSEFELMQKDGRGPLMDTEDMDIFFCAQEYEYNPSFVKRTRIKSSQVGGNEATATIVSALGWETNFKFTKVGGKWKIAGYCVYQ